MLSSCNLEKEGILDPYNQGCARVVEVFTKVLSPEIGRERPRARYWCLASFRVLPEEFYERDPETVAKELLGKRLTRKLEGNLLGGIIVETEAYYGLDDPASRAYDGVKGYNRLMWEEPGKAFIYNVHKYWMFNIVAHRPGQIGAVLVRALQPTEGLEVMKRNRPVRKAFDIANGPGKLSIALGIDKKLNGTPVTSSDSEITISDNTVKPEIGSSHRIGVKKDLKKKLRFYIKKSKFVSR